MCERSSGGNRELQREITQLQGKAWIEIQLFQLLLSCPQPSLLKEMEILCILELLRTLFKKKNPKHDVGLKAIIQVP